MTSLTPETFAGIGRMIRDKDLREICILEFERGVIVTGTVLRETAEGYFRQLETHILTGEDLDKLAKEPQP